jgi:hypothetical protein
VEEPALAQQIPEDWAAELQLTQEQIWSAVPLGLAFHVGTSIAAYLRPHLSDRALPSEHKAGCRRGSYSALASLTGEAQALSLREIRLGGVNRLAVRCLE